LITVINVFNEKLQSLYRVKRNRNDEFSVDVCLKTGSDVADLPQSLTPKWRKRKLQERISQLKKTLNLF